MKKIFAVLLLLVVCSCYQSKYRGQITDTHLLNNTVANASLDTLCKMLNDYASEKKVVDRVLYEFNVRNVSYRYCYR